MHVEGLLSKVRADLQAALHDMNTVYLESIPADMTLEEVPPVVMVRNRWAVCLLFSPSLHTYIHTPADMRAWLLVLQVKSSPVPDSIVGESIPNLLSYLLPRQISDLFQSTSVNLTNLLSRSEAMSQEATLTARSTLSSVGLPGSLELANANMIGMYICIIYNYDIAYAMCNAIHCRPTTGVCMVKDCAASRNGRL